MSQPVIIKSNKYGINLILDKALPFRELLGHIKEKFLESDKFFKNARMAISFEGRELTPEEEYQIIDTISQNTSIHIACVIDNNEIREQLVKQKMDEYDSIAAGNTGKIYKGTLRSGHVLESEASLIVIGDVNPGAKVVSAGNIVILGALKGTAYAGETGDNTCFVAALDMNPMQIKIGDVIGRSEDKGFLASLKERKKSTAEPQIATVSGNQILIEPITKNTFNNM